MTDFWLQVTSATSGQRRLITAF